LAVGRGLSGASATGSGQDFGKDPQVELALLYLGMRVGNKDLASAPKNGGKIIHANAWGDLYFLWSLERVAVVYGLTTIGGKDWYSWGADVLLGAQAGVGSWNDSFAGPVDTCFALLFLKRANVATDLTALLEKLGGARDPGAPVMEHQPVVPGAVRAPTQDPAAAEPGRVKTRSGYSK
jgi:hypothetical protein